MARQGRHSWADRQGGPDGLDGWRSSPLPPSLPALSSLPLSRLSITRVRWEVETGGGGGRWMGMAGWKNGDRTPPPSLSLLALLPCHHPGQTLGRALTPHTSPSLPSLPPYPFSPFHTSPSSFSFIHTWLTYFLPLPIFGSFMFLCCEIWSLHFVVLAQVETCCRCVCTAYTVVPFVTCLPTCCFFCHTLVQVKQHAHTTCTRFIHATYHTPYLSTCLPLVGILLWFSACPEPVQCLGLIPYLPSSYTCGMILCTPSSILTYLLLNCSFYIPLQTVPACLVMGRRGTTTHRFVLLRGTHARRTDGRTDGRTCTRGGDRRLLPITYLYLLLLPLRLANTHGWDRTGRGVP